MPGPAAKSSLAQALGYTTVSASTLFLGYLDRTPGRTYYTYQQTTSGPFTFNFHCLRPLQRQKSHSATASPPVPPDSLQASLTLTGQRCRTTNYSSAQSPYYASSPLFKQTKNVYA
ncbi:hypothetical protein BDV10DRAFT_179788 [Aspergillus recurvatus]